MSTQKRTLSPAGSDTGSFTRRGAVSRLQFISMDTSAPVSAQTTSDVHPTCPSQHPVHASCCFCAATPQPDPLRSNPVSLSYACPTFPPLAFDFPLSHMALTTIHPVITPMEMCTGSSLHRPRFTSPFAFKTARKARMVNYSYKTAPISAATGARSSSSRSDSPRNFSDWVSSSKSVLGRKAAKHSLKNPHILALIAESAQERTPITLACDIDSVAPEAGCISVA